ncbi:hypothetical protein BH09GEM1_BH09GEM1_36850 [soil metagenome]
MAPLSPPNGDVAFIVDILVTWIGAAALARYVMVVGSVGERSPLERRARFLIGALATLLFVRGFSWLSPDSRWLAFLTFVPVALLPLAMTVFAEGLLRRHVPAWMKIFAATSTAIVLLADLSRIFVVSERRLAVISMLMLGVLLASMSALGALLVRRDRASLSKSENALVRVCIIVTAVALPLGATDFRFELGAPPVRLGTLGILLFCYTLLRQPEENVRVGRWLGDVSRLIARALLFGGLVAVAISSTGMETIVPILVLGSALVLAFAVFDRLRDIERSTPQTLLLRWLARERPATWQQFARELRALPLTADAELLEGHALAQYDSASLVQAFDSQLVHSLAHLRALRDSTRSAARAADELSDLLERHGATHVGLLAANPLRLLVATAPELAGMRDVELALAAVVRRGQQVSAMEDHVGAS